MIPKSSLRTIRYMHCVQNNIARALDSDFIKSSLLIGLARKVADSPDVAFRSSPADAIDDSRFAEASVCVVSAEARLTLERRHALFEAMQLRAFALLAFRDALLAVQRESVPCLTTLSMIEQRFISVVATMYVEQIKESL